MERSKALLLVVVVGAAAVGLAGANFRDECDIPWEPQNARFTDDGNGLSLSLVSNSSGTTESESESLACFASMIWFLIYIDFHEHEEILHLFRYAYITYLCTTARIYTHSSIQIAV